MAYNQIYSIVNASTKNMVGATSIAARDTASFVDIGGKIMGDDGVNIPIFMNGLMGVLRDTYIKAKAYNRREKISARRAAEDFGLYLRKIQRTNIQDTGENSSYKAQDWDYYDGSLAANWTDRIFGKVAGYETTPIIIADKQLEKCFHNEAEFAAFVDMLYTGMANDVEVHAETVESLARATAIATCFLSNKTSINLSTKYAAAFPNADAIDASNWMYDANFIRFAIVEMKKVYRNMRTFNRVYNNEGADRFSRDGELIFDIHANFVGAMEGYLENTLIEKFIELPTFNPVTRWQSTGTSASFEEATEINIKNTDYVTDATTTPETTLSIAKEGVLAFIHDIDKYALTVDDLRTVNARNSLQEMTTSVSKYDIAYAIDPSEQGVVFYVNDAT